MRLWCFGVGKGRLLKLALLAAVALLLINIGSGRTARAFSSGPPASHTAAPGEVSCTACHGSYPVNYGLGSVSLGGVPLHYTPDQQINLTITTAHPDGYLYGFQLTALDVNGSSAGTIVVTDADNTQLVSGFVSMGGLRTYLEHTFDGAFPVEFDRRVWSFAWKAPATNIGPVIFYIAGNGANGDHETTGDYIYLSDRTLGCTAATPSSSSFDALGGNSTFSLSSSCSWGAVSQSSWIHITSTASGNGDGSLNYSVDANPLSTSRSGSILIDGIAVPVVQGAKFADVDVNNIFYNHIGKLSARGVTLGCGGGSYCPGSSVTREQMAAFITRALGVSNPTPPPFPTFVDVPQSNIFYGFVEELARRGITQGCGNDVNGNRLFCPSATVTREQMAAFMIRALGVVNPPTPAMQRFTDVPPTNIFYAFIEEMALRGITLGCGTDIYCPQSPVSREQMAAFLVRGFSL
jgi:hypothetical protein